MENIIIKDIKLMLSDKKALALIILMPIVLTTILSFALSGSFTEIGDKWKLDIAIVKEYNADKDINKFIKIMKDYSKNYNINEVDISNIMQNTKEFNPEKTFFNDFLSNEKLQEVIKYEICTEEEAYRLLEEKKIGAIIILPENYVYDSYINMFTPFRNNIEIRVVGHPDMNYSANIVEELVKGYNNIISSIVISKNVFMEASTKHLKFEEIINGMDEVFSDIDIDSSKLSISQNTLEGKNYISSFSYYTVAMLAMFILYSASYGGKYLLEEKDNSTYYRIQVSGRNESSIIIGKFVMMVVIVLIQSFSMILFSILVFKVNWINLPLTMIVAILSALAVGSIGMLIASISLKANNYKASDAFSSVIVQILALFGGSYIPTDVMPEIIGEIGQFTPNGAVLNAYIKIMEGYGMKELVPYLMVIIVNIIIFLVLSRIIIKGGKVNVKHANVKA